MRVLMMISGIAMGGAERNVISVLPFLQKVPGITPYLGTLNTWRDSPLSEGFDRTSISRLNMEADRLIDPGGIYRFFHLLKEAHIDLINTQDQYTSIYGALAHFGTRIPVVTTRHVLEEPADTFRERTRAMMALWAIRHGCRSVVAVSDSVRCHLETRGGVPISKIETIHNGIDVEAYSSQISRAEKRRALGWLSDDRIVIMVAVLRRGKGHEILFEAIPSLRRAIPGVKIKIVGDGELDRELRSAARRFGTLVEFMGQRLDIPELLGASDVLVLPSWSEALPTVLMEAGAASLPVVATDVGGAQEIVDNRKTGFLVPPGCSTALADRVIEVLKDPRRAREMGASARALIESRFSLERQAENLAALYARVRGTL